MTTEEIIRAKLAETCAQRGGQSEIAKAFEVHPSTVKRWAEGGDIPPPTLKLLNLYFFEIIPFDIVSENLLNSVLSFTEHQWRVICILAKRQGQSPGEWIASQIRAYLAMDDEARSARERLEAAQKASSAGVSHLQEVMKVAEDPAPYGSQKGKA